MNWPTNLSSVPGVRSPCCSCSELHWTTCQSGAEKGWKVAKYEHESTSLFLASQFSLLLKQLATGHTHAIRQARPHFIEKTEGRLENKVILRMGICEGQIHAICSLTGAYSLRSSKNLFSRFQEKSQNKIQHFELSCSFFSTAGRAIVARRAEWQAYRCWSAVKFKMLYRVLTLRFFSLEMHALKNQTRKEFSVLFEFLRKHACYCSCLHSCLSKAPFTRSPKKKYLTLTQKNATRGGFCPQKKNLCPKSPSSKFKSKLHLSIVFSLSKES